jgi:8-oxo-dGTP pyrophosphatase MutT (NUDIX family)
MELGESVEETGRRELFEETGITVGKLNLIDIFSGSEYFVKCANGDEFYSVTMADLLETKKKRYIEPYIEYLKIVLTSAQRMLNCILQRVNSNYTVLYVKW